MSLEGPAFKRIEKAKSTTYVVTDDLVSVSGSVIHDLKEAARQDPLKRARLCLHRSSGDALHQMIIAHHRDTYTHPHRHRNKAESFNMIEGRLLVVFFDDAGKVTAHLVLGGPGSQDPSIYRLSISEWHTVVPLTEYAVFHEITSGPFAPGDAELAAWAPSESSSSETAAFKSRLVELLVSS
jgi:cupin fold WbuC family metalloprotein